MIRKLRDILVSLILIFSFSGTVNADHQHGKPYNFYYTQVPLICTDFSSLNEFINDHKLEAIGLSVARENSSPDGNIAYWVTTFMDKDKTQTMATIHIDTRPSEVCIFYYTMDLNISPEWKIEPNLGF